MMNNKELVCGWGRYKFAEVDVFSPKNSEELKNKIVNSNLNSLIARGLGRSYGDSAQLDKKEIIKLEKFQKIELHKESATVTAQAGVTFDQLLNYIVPKGFFLPVSPGTRFVTVGGAIAADVHGKNHHIDGSFGRSVLKILLMDGNSQLLELKPSNENPENSAQFWATIGGMGLTGIILEATFSLIPISTSFMKVDTKRFKDIYSLMDEMIVLDNKYRYTVAWIDCLNSSLRGVLTNGNHAEFNDIEKKDSKDKLSYYLKAKAKTPNFLPSGLLNKLTAGAFNEAWFRKSPRFRENEIQNIGQYFYPLDGVENWNRLYGPAGFLQYQFVVPDKYSEVIIEILNELKKISVPSFLTVLKRFGKSNPAPLSFPINGWTLAIDIPSNIPNLLSTLNNLDEKVVSVGGRLYLAKDARQSSLTFRESYPRLDEWISTRNKMDPKNIFMSDSFLRILG